ncbi:HAD-IB family hydrolase [Aeromicrobium camelliae]|uniref:HAD-IB family hydrolase n=1 Tax=Aeromicrobium camelliae TaxID=1538144 RepID=A0A3N6WLB8_9ACTN|nr:HAD-IB family hydrolase [Aeromicrobium camelliae]RQN02113.1 HAD-IB family hydrolase [Aeromicrobium camelliae]
MSPGGQRRLPRNLQSRSFLAGQAAAASAEVERALEPAADRSAAAFFDVDNTIMQGASIFHLARGLHRREFFSGGDLWGLLWKQLYFQYLGGERPDHIADARSSALAFVRGHRVDELREIGEEVFDEYMAHRIWPGTRALAQWHLDRGQRVWLITAAPIEIAEVIARRLGLTGALGTVAESVDGVYTGRLVGELLHGEGKAVAVLDLAEREGLDLSRCYAYSDSGNDLPMLSLVGHPCAVNPDAKLRAQAKAEGWLIRDYRTGRRLTIAASRVALAGIAVWGAGALARRALRARSL